MIDVNYSMHACFLNVQLYFRFLYGGSLFKSDINNFLIVMLVQLEAQGNILVLNFEMRNKSLIIYSYFLFFVILFSALQVQFDLKILVICYMFKQT